MMTFNNINEFNQTINYKDEFIDQSSIGYIFGLSTWQSGLALIFLLVAIVALVLIYKKWGKKISLVSGFGIGIIGLIIFGIIFHYLPPTPYFQEDGSGITWVDEVNDWLMMPSSIFLSLISFVIPLYVFGSIILLINNQNKKAKSHAWMFSSSMILLIILPLIGIAVALLLLPLINLIPEGSVLVGGETEATENASIPNIVVMILPYSLMMFTSPAFLGSVVVFAILIGVVIKMMEKNHEQRHHDIVYFFETFKIVSNSYLKYVLLLIPLVIATRLPMLMLVPNVGQLEFVGYYLELFVIGGAIIMIILTTIILLVSPAKKYKMDTLVEHWANSVANPSLATMLPITKETTKKLGAGEDMSEITPTLGVSMGLVMCGGFTPTLIALLAANNVVVTDPGTSMITLGFIFLVIIYVFIASFGTSGVGHADSIIILAVLGSLGLTPEVYLTIMVIAPITELIAVGINSTGQIAATMVNDAFHYRKNPSCDIHDVVCTKEWELKEIQNHLKNLKANSSSTKKS